MPRRPETTDLPLVLVLAIGASVVIKPAGYSSIPRESTTDELARKIRVKNGGFYVQKPLASVRYLHFVSRTHPLVLLTDRGKAMYLLHFDALGQTI